MSHLHEICEDELLIDECLNILNSLDNLSELPVPHTIQYLRSPPVVVDTWDTTDDEEAPPWVHQRAGKVRCIDRPTWVVVPFFTAMASEPDNEAKKQAIFKWCSGV
ncbi:hypothetical protein HYDPIDRAFT_169418 [Hydnomerulius pinastri MD-312]|uniref:Uncharacterized protein n=1 Tax=Hydnomerulius pinastri MD-312 TaxID=994086 RepID=A0A0C9VVE1_9AGAM|nr:hypothetical protein HYDPIDRAFT_169418 [Hydnomerulius pinastri MD-312]